MQECRQHNLDEFHTKSIERVSRDRNEIKLWIEEMRMLGIPAICENQNLNTATDEVYYDFLCRHSAGQGMDEIVKLPIVYRMQRKNCTAESFIELPVTKAVYDAILKDGRHGINLDTDNKPQQLIRIAMRAVCKLQGYTLTAIIPDIKTEG